MKSRRAGAISRSNMWTSEAVSIGVFRLNKGSMDQIGAFYKWGCATLSGGTLETTSSEVSMREYLTINQFEHTKLIGENVTLSVDSVISDICCRTIIAAQEQTIIFDWLHQCPQTNQVSVTIKVLCNDLITSTNASVNLLFDLCCFLISYKLRSGRHLTGKVHNFFYIRERFLTVQNVCFRFHKLHRVSIIPDCTVRHCYCLTQILLCIIASVRRNDNLLRNYLTKFVSNRVGAILIITAKTNKITLVDSIGARKIIKARMQNRRNLTLIEHINFFMIVCNTNLFLVKDCFRTYKELTTGGVDSPYNCGSTVNLNAKSAASSKPIQNTKVAVQDRIFGVLEVNVFHTLSIAEIRGICKGSCATSQTVTRVR